MCTSTKVVNFGHISIYVFNFQAMTGIDDVGEAIGHLEAADWSLMVRTLATARFRLLHTENNAKEFCEDFAVRARSFQG